MTSNELICVLDDQEFCHYPITYNLNTNPYRCRPETSRGSRFLLHAILAYASHIRLRLPLQKEPPEDALVHKNTALQFFRDARENEISSADRMSLLDTALLLWQLDVS